MSLSKFDAGVLNTMLDGLKTTAEGFVRAGTDGEIHREVTAFMRYAGQGWEIPVSLPDRPFTSDDVSLIRDAFLARYTQFFGRPVEGPEIQFVTFSVKAQDIRPEGAQFALDDTGTPVDVPATRAVFDPASGAERQTAIVDRDTLAPGARISGPAVIVERETSTVVTSPFDAVIQADETILLVRKGN
jgi:N-methylhydantoinase A